MADFAPKRSMAECDAILTAPGAPFELQHVVIRGVVQRVYKNAPDSLRTLFLGSAQEFSARDYIVFESERYTFGKAFARASRLASIFRQVYGIRKGDRVALVMRNYPEWLISFWAIHLLGAVSVLVNAWLPAKIVSHCIVHTESKLIVMDAEQADNLAPILAKTKKDAGATGVLVARAHDGRHSWKKHAESFEAVMDKYHAIDPKSWEKEPACHPEDGATIYFTSGTTGLPKGVYLTHRAIISACFVMIVASMRTALRLGQDIPEPEATQLSYLLPVPLFHCTGSCSTSIPSTLFGGKIVLMRKWDASQGLDIIEKEKITNTGGVPSIAMDLLAEKDFERRGASLVALVYGGTTSPPQIAEKVGRLPGTLTNGQGYGLTETTGAMSAVIGEDSIARPRAAGYPALVADILIMDPKTGKSLPRGEVGEIWIRSSQVMVGYWKNPEATNRVLTKDGWFNSEDLGSMDEDGFLYVHGRVKDLIIRGGENIDVVGVENALYGDDRVSLCAVVGVPDARLGELPAAVVYLRPNARATEQELIESVRSHLPAFAVPVMIMFSKERFEVNAAGKILKSVLKEKAKREWERRGGRVAAKGRL
ncbi:hypothetical protein BS47DRAFT_1335956 [Hydnum rufescens UP504]|uniref:Acetyl-CoA synthetase-like protein n=1 Tax=Hydnum rufescens UP504 TaxID=1448309 RepID=A0A9P6BA52_9AGAM|nr:hypothetical protein BS47DRAFT_1335956 [Hydnum rufescens UP504]